MDMLRSLPSIKFSTLVVYLSLLIIIEETLVVQSIAIYTPSDAYQESILKPVSGFSDVAIFHYTVPSQTSKATWTFVAFSDEVECDEKIVHIYLRYGAYPVVSIDNTSFPENTVLPEDFGDVQYHVEGQTHFQPQEMPKIELENPSPGSWFAVAFISGDFGNAIQQKGISHLCHYSLGSMASWTQETNVHLLIPGSPIYVNNVSETTWFKIFVPENTWRFRVKLSNCAYQIRNDSSSMVEVMIDFNECLHAFGVAANALPTLVSGGNMSSELMNNETLVYFHDLLQPQHNVYYYIGLLTNTSNYFRLEVNLEECESQSSNIMKLPSVSQLRNMSTMATGRNSTLFHNHHYHNALEESAMSVAKAPSNGDMLKCFLVMTLTRIKHAQEFLDSFLFQGRDWFSSTLKLRDRESTYVRFDILPFVDIGGTLLVKFQLDRIAREYKFPFVIDICLSQRIPAIVEGEAILCPSERLSMQVVSNDSSRNSAVRLLPFPQPGTWFITFLSACEANASSGNLTCEKHDVRLDLRVRLQPCIMEGDQCGPHGFCKENHFRHYFFSSCHCANGWKGWSCSDGRDAVSPYLTLFQSLLLISSNLFFVPAVFLAIKWRFYAEAVVYLATMLFSSLYHACDTENVQICLFKYDVLQFCDFYSAILSFWVTVVAMSDLPETISSMAHMAGALGIALAVQSEKTGLWTFVVPVVAGITMMLLSWGRQCMRTKSFQFSKKLLNIIPGAALAATGLVLFAFLETDRNYKYVHSGWHATIALSISFLLPRNDKRVGGTKLATNCTTPLHDVVFDQCSVRNEEIQELYRIDPEDFDIGGQKSTDRAQLLIL